MRGLVRGRFRLADAGIDRADLGGLWCRTEANGRTLQRRAGRITIKEMEEALREHKAFGFESICSGRSRPALIERVRLEGDLVDTVFIGISDPSLSATDAWPLHPLILEHGSLQRLRSARFRSALRVSPLVDAG